MPELHSIKLTPDVIAAIVEQPINPPADEQWQVFDRLLIDHLQLVADAATERAVQVILEWLRANSYPLPGLILTVEFEEIGILSREAPDA